MECIIDLPSRTFGIPSPPPEAYPDTRKWLVVLSEDDCDPDARESFEISFAGTVGLSVSDFQRQARRREANEEMTVAWLLGDLELSHSGDDPYYRLVKRPATSPSPAKCLNDLHS